MLINGLPRSRDYFHLLPDLSRHVTNFRVVTWHWYRCQEAAPDMIRDDFKMPRPLWVGPRRRI